MDISPDSEPQQAPRTIYLKDYTPPPYLISKVQLDFDLEAGTTHVRSVLTVQRNDGVADDVPLVLDGIELELCDVGIDGQALTAEQYQLGDESLSIPNVPNEFSLAIHNITHPDKNTALEGLYASGHLLSTQCEAEGFRRITYFLDRPDVMSEFTVTLKADKSTYPILLSNGNPVAKGAEGNKHWVTWHDPSLKPCYLFAIVAGQLECMKDTFTTMSGKTVDLRVYVEAENRHKCDHAMTSLKQSMTWDEQTYGREYDLDIFMIVAVNDFNMGAMENKGLNIFNSSCVLASPEAATDADFYRIQSIIGHEYFHNWSGNRVTCRDWFQLSLKEGFTVFRDEEFSADLNSRPVKRIDDVNVLRVHQFAEDAGPLAHPIRPDQYIEISNFYTVTVYNKGAEIVRMIKNLLGWDAFRKGTDLYFDRHDGQAVTTDDFVKAMEDANAVDLTQFKRWYAQAGTPVVDVQGTYDASKQTYTLTINQSCPATPNQPDKQPFHIPFAMGLLDAQGQALQLDSDDVQCTAATHAVIELTEPSQFFVFKNIKAEPVPSLLREFSAPVIVKFAYSDEQLALLLANDEDSFNRWEASQNLALNTLLKLIESDCKISVPSYLLEAYASLLNDSMRDNGLDKALATQALTLPSESYIADQLDVVDVGAIHKAREHLKLAMANHLEDALLSCYQGLTSNEAYQFNADAMAKRSLKNLTLHYLVCTGKEQYIELCYQQASTASNMTDQLAAFSALVYYDNPKREKVIAEFYTQWHTDNQVLEKWFAIQAAAPVSGILDQVRALMQHQDFTLTNPNKVRAVIGRFCMGNPTAFHHADGSGYAFLTEQIIALDKLNPQISARLLQAMIRWQRYDEPRQILMKQAFATILKQDGLSKDVFEIAERGLHS